MKINDIIIKEAHETGEGNRKLAAIGRVLMDKAVTQKDDGLSNVMATLGDNLTRYNTTFGPRSPAELMKKSNITSKELMMKLLKFGEAELAKVADEPEDDEKYSASDDEIDAKARAMAKG
jgi:hypothetical protein